MASTKISSTVVTQFETGHQATVHSSELDYFGKCLATSSSDRLVKVFRVENGSTQHVADLVGHAGPVYKVSFSSPKNGSYLASASFDGSIIVWENRNNDSVTWQQATQAYNQNGAAVNSVAWAPYADAKVVAGACADGSILVAELSGGAWQVSTIPDAHDIGAMDVTWAPQVGPHGTRRLATCGCDGAVKVWGFDASSGTWVQEGGNLVGHGDWVRSCDWAPAAGLSSTATVVSAGQDGKVVVWRLVGREWVSSTVCALGKAVWCARWNSNGSLIAVTDEAQTVSLWKQVGDAWMNVS